MCVKCRGTRRAIAFGSSAALPRVCSARSSPVCRARRWGWRPAGGHAPGCRSLLAVGPANDTAAASCLPVGAQQRLRFAWWISSALICSQPLFTTTHLCPWPSHTLNPMLHHCSSCYFLSVSLPAYFATPFVYFLLLALQIFLEFFHKL